MYDYCLYFQKNINDRQSRRQPQKKNPLTSRSVFDSGARRVSVWGQCGVAVRVGVGEGVVGGLCVSHVRKGIALLLLWVGEDPVECSFKIIILESDKSTPNNTRLRLFLLHHNMTNNTFTCR